jgi:hypothetical protein
MSDSTRTCDPDGLTLESNLQWTDPDAAHAMWADDAPCSQSEELCDPTTLTACLTLNRLARLRLKALWAACTGAGADEISDWSTGFECQLRGGETEPPPVAAVSATVYANGEVNFELFVGGVVQALRFEDSYHIPQV